MATMSTTYLPDRFVDREKEIEQIKNLLQQPKPPVRAVVIEGERGAGKTWLSLHLHRVVFKQLPAITSFFFSLADPGEDTFTQSAAPQDEWFIGHRTLDEAFLDDLLDVFLAVLSLTPYPESTVGEKVSMICHSIRTHPDVRYLMILDSAYESDWTFLEKLEEQFLSKALVFPNFFMIITGRGRPYPWKIPELIEAMRLGLEPFPIEYVQEQLNRLGLSPNLSVEDIFDIGQGWPLFTERLAQAREREEALEMAANLLFSIVPPGERTVVRSYFEALCPLDGFAETEAEEMVRADVEGKKEVPDGRTICRTMHETRMIAWKNGRYEMNRPVQVILRQYLKLEKHRRRWERLNRAAFEYYKARSEDNFMKRFQPYFQEQAKRYAQIVEALRNVNDFAHSI